ncbi:MAG: tetratricopeptide repeat protein [Sedimentisphaerales bacterium]|nr:tetratricopeptide repeat protein [Sedimentisphaerales bacterium]
MQTEIKQGRLNTLILKNGNLHLPSPASALPKELIEANDAAAKGMIEEATRLLSNKVEKAMLEIIEQDPHRTDIMLVLGMLFKQTRQIKKAKGLFEKILLHEPHPLVYNELGYLYQCTGQLSQAIQYQQKAVEADPNNAELMANLARMMIETGKVQEGIDLFRKALEIEPANAALHSSFLFHLHFLPNPDPRMIFQEHKRWGQIHAPASLAGKSHNNDRNPDRKLRIGYISPDFCAHSVVYFFESLLDGHNRNTVEVFGYGNVRIPADVTERLRQKFDHYRNIWGIDDSTVVDMIQKDQIDILVDLSGHTTDNRLPVMAHKPAPIQATYLGYIDTTGLEVIDYILTDSIADPPNSQKFYTEKPALLPDGFLCYRPVGYAPPVTSLPANRNGYITFGVLCNNRKINPNIMELWAEILRANKKSRLLLSFATGNDPEMRNYYLGKFERLGIDDRRVAVCGGTHHAEHLKYYSQADIILDTFPLNGATTTCEALWMGVPVITLTGELHVSRVGLSILTRIGLEFFAASTPKEYITRATALANNRQALENLRATMRERMNSSILRDSKKFASGVETVYRKMWHRWIEST